jgi:hypothetical protein
LAEEYPVFYFLWYTHLEREKEGEGEGEEEWEKDGKRKEEGRERERGREWRKKEGETVQYSAVRYATVQYVRYLYIYVIPGQARISNVLVLWCHFTGHTGYTGTFPIEILHLHCIILAFSSIFIVFRREVCKYAKYVLIFITFFFLRFWERRREGSSSRPQGRGSARGSVRGRERGSVGRRERGRGRGRGWCGREEGERTRGRGRRR